jgi:hypothetical protein
MMLISTDLISEEHVACGRKIVDDVEMDVR